MLHQHTVFFCFFFQWNAALHFPVSTRLACKVILVGWGGWGREFLPLSDGMSGHSASNFVAYGSSFD